LKEVKYELATHNLLFKEASMGLRRNVSLATGLRYQGQGPMLTFVLHRIGGLGMAVFITTHILASYLGGDMGKLLNTIYENWLFQVVVFFCVLFHAINGLRITILDLWPKLIQFQREAIWIEWAVFIPIYGVAVLVIARTGLGG
jgi:succinate dehydrogenase cytochrome b subunit